MQVSDEEKTESVAVYTDSLDIQASENMVDIKRDFVFKNIMSVEENKDVLASFLSAVLKEAFDVREITILNSEFPKAGTFMVGMRFDVQLKLRNNTYCDVEVQCYLKADTADTLNCTMAATGPVGAEDFLGRARVAPTYCQREDKTRGLLDQACRMSYENLRGGKNKERPRIICIWITDKNLTHQPGPFHVGSFHYRKQGEREAVEMSDRLQLIFLELGKFHPKTLDEKNKLDLWMAFLKNPDSEEVPDFPEFKKARKTLRFLRADTGFKKTLLDIDLALLEQERQIEEGKTKKAREMALEMLSDGVSLEKITKYSGLSLEEVLKLSKNP